MTAMGCSGCLPRSRGRNTEDVWKDMPSFEGARAVRVASLPAD